MSEEAISVSKGKKPSTGVRVLLGVLSVLLCLCLCVSLTATALILDFRLITAEDTIQQIAGSLLSAPRQTRHLPITAAVGGMPAATSDDSDGQTTEQLVAWLYHTLKEQHGEELLVTQEQMQTFLDQSTTKEYLTDKIASYANDFINGTNTTTITSEELNWLIEENNAAIETQLGIQIDDEARQQVLSFAEEMNIGEVIRTEVIEKMEDVTISDTISGDSDGYTVGDLMATLRSLTSTTALIISITVNVLLVVALFFTNRMRLSGTLCGVGIPLTFIGGLLTLATCALQYIPSLLPVVVGNVLMVLAGSIAPVHFTMLGLGVAALIGAVVAKVLRKK